MVNQRNGWRTRLLAMLFGTFVACVLTEVGLRLFARPAEEMIFLSKDGSIEWDCYCSNPRGYFTPRQIKDGRTVYCVDHANDPPRAVDLADPRFTGSYKILAVGDSFTWGLGVKLRDSWPLKLTELLNGSRFGMNGRSVPVVVSNRGEIGFDVAAVRETYFQATAKVVPDLCVYGYCLNDPIDGVAGRTQFVHARRKAADMDNENIYDGINIRVANLKRLQRDSFGSDLRQVSKLVDFGLNQWEWRAIHQSVVQSHLDLYDPSKNSQGLRISYGFIADMNRRQKEAGKRFLVVIFPLLIDIDGAYPFARVHEQITLELQRMGVECLDLLPTYRKQNAASLWVHPVDQHPNELAHGMAAQAILDRVLATTENKLVP